MRVSHAVGTVVFGIVAAVLVAAWVGVVSAASTEPDGFAIWKHSDLADWRLNAKLNEHGFAVQILERYENHVVMNVHVTRNGLAELHESTTDTYIVQSGEATLVLGGTIAEPDTVNPGEIRGPSIEGGSRRQMGPGDIVHIPANVPHQVLVDRGKTLSFVILKIEQ